MAAEETDELDPAVVSGKIVEYEAFIENVLKKELEIALDEFRKERENIRQCKELRNNINMLQSGQMTELETMIDLGCQFFAKAFVPDTSRLFVNVGLGFHLEMQFTEALAFLDQKEAALAPKISSCKTRIARVKADIHEALHIIDLMMKVQGGGKPWLDGMDEDTITALSA